MTAIAASSGWHPDQLVTVSVTFHPEMSVFERQMQALPAVTQKIVVDNASAPEEQDELRQLLSTFPNVTLLCNAENRGLAAALDQGIRHAVEHLPACRNVLLLDQDSEPQPGSISRLATAFADLQRQGGNPGAVGPQLCDPDTQLSHGFHQMTRWRWRRAFVAANSCDPLAVANLNGSGTYMPVGLYLQLGGLDHSLFIDHVDTEWSFRLLASGHSLWGVPDAWFTHSMGEQGLRFWMVRWRVWPRRSPLRHRYLFRNTLWLMRRAYVPMVWKAWASVKLALTALVCAAADSRRIEQLRAMGQGLAEGLRSQPRRQP